MVCIHEYANTTRARIVWVGELLQILQTNNGGTMKNNKHIITKVTLTKRTPKGIHVRTAHVRNIKGKYTTFHYEGKDNG